MEHNQGKFEDLLSVPKLLFGRDTLEVKQHLELGPSGDLEIQDLKNLELY